jgi:hypothetical protein
MQIKPNRSILEGKVNSVQRAPDGWGGSPLGAARKERPHAVATARIGEFFERWRNLLNRWLAAGQHDQAGACRQPAHHLLQLEQGQQRPGAAPPTMSDERSVIARSGGREHQRQ